MSFGLRCVEFSLAVVDIALIISFGGLGAVAENGHKTATEISKNLQLREASRPVNSDEGFCRGHRWKHRCMCFRAHYGPPSAPNPGYVCGFGDYEKANVLVMTMRFSGSPICNKIKQNKITKTVDRGFCYFIAAFAHLQ